MVGCIIFFMIYAVFDLLPLMLWTSAVFHTYSIYTQHRRVSPWKNGSVPAYCAIGAPFKYRWCQLLKILGCNACMQCICGLFT